MPAKDLGSKHVCFKCGTKFYDMRKPAAICPKCGADQRESPALRPAASERRAKAPPKPPPVEPAVELTEEDAEIDEDLEEGAEEELAESDDEG
jgi:uncharacterized protein (TIGR02300 family)